MLSRCKGGHRSILECFQKYLALNDVLLAIDISVSVQAFEEPNTFIKNTKNGHSPCRLVLILGSH